MSEAIFPLFTRGAFGSDVMLLIEVLVGMGFGFALERSGFARSENLVSIFYGRDFRVMRVMFTAIVTAMAGLVVLSGAGLFDMGLLYINETFIWPQLVGGLLLGAGFVISGYCPGTSIVGAASGRLDALFVIGGVGVGSWLYSEAFPLVGAFASSGSMGTASLPSVTGLPVWAVAAFVMLFAGGAFIAVGRIEKWVRARYMGTSEPAPGPAPIELSPRRVAPHHALFVVGLVAVLALGIAYGTRSKPSDWGRYVGPDEHARAGRVLAAMKPLELARQIIDGRRDLTIIDIRATGTKDSIPGSLSMSPSDLETKAVAHDLPLSDETILVGASGDGHVHDLAKILARHGHQARWLSGGYEAWKRTVLSAPEPPAGHVTSSQVVAFEELASIHSWFTGSRASAPKVQAAPAAQVAPKKRKGGGCS